MMKILSFFAVFFLTTVCWSIDFVPAGKGVTPADIVVPRSKASEYAAAANTFKKYIKRITGIELPVKAASAGKRIEFALSSKLHADAFSVTFPGKDVMRITGGSSLALEYAVFELLERYGKCRWLFPGPLGEVVPAASRFAVPASDFSEAPHFKDRTIGISWSKWESAHCGIWFKQIRRSTSRVKFSHNTFSLLDPKIFQKDHPEFYPVYGGKRLDPLKERRRWQPCFSAPGIAEAAAERICRYFKSRGMRSYSLGAHDISDFCECKNCLALENGKRNRLSYIDRSGSYIYFCNRVAALVTKKYPEAKLGFLAYVNIMDPPEGKVDPALVPFITYDRHQWLEPEKRKMDQELTRAWHRKVPEIGWYDYAYGNSYNLPRLYLHVMQNYLQWGYANGVRYYYCEYAPGQDWHEGPKFYMLAKLLWNPGIDLEAALNDWYVNAVGAKAAPWLKKYFDSCEKYWTKKVPELPFFKVNDTYLDFKSNLYLDAYTSADLDRSAALLEKAVQLAGSGRQRQRAEFFRSSFREREKWLRSYVRHRELALAKEKYKFDVLLMKNDFSRGIPGSWQDKNGTFFHDKTAGINGSPAAGMNLSGSNKRPMVYLFFPKDKNMEFFKAVIKYKVVGTDPVGIFHPWHFESPKVSFMFKWQGSATSDPYSKKITWLPGSIASGVFGDMTPDGKWRTMTIYARRPPIPFKRMVLLFSVYRTGKGIVYIDDFELTAAAVPAK